MLLEEDTLLSPYACSLAAVDMAKNRGHRILYGRYTTISSSDSTFPEVQEKIELLNYQHYFDINQNRIIGDNGSKIVFKGFKASSGNQTANLKSLKDFSCMIVEEAEEIPDYDTYEKVALSIRGNEPNSEEPNIKILILNPTSKENWIYKHFFLERGVPDGFNGVKDNTCYIHTSYLDCLEFVPDDIKRSFEMMKRNNPKRYKNVVEGGWLDKAEGVVFDNWEIGEFDESLPYIYGLDFGFSHDPTALVKVAVKDDKLYLKEELYEKGLSTKEIIKRLRDIGINNYDLIVADNAEPRLIHELKEDGFNMKKSIKGADSVRAGIKRLQDYKMIVEENSSNLIVELNNYVWNDKKAGVPVDDYNHLCDGIRYSCNELLKNKTQIIW